MAILKLSHCDLFIWTSHGHHHEPLSFDNAFWNMLVSNIAHFWRTYDVAPKLLTDVIYMSDVVSADVDHRLHT